jgi:hypothetical protein
MNSFIKVKSILNFDGVCIPSEPVTEEILLQIIENNKGESSEEDYIESQNILRTN